MASSTPGVGGSDVAARRVPKPPRNVSVASLADTGDPATDRVMIQAEQNLQDLQEQARAAATTAAGQAGSITSLTSGLAALTATVAAIPTSGRLLAAPQRITAGGTYPATPGATHARIRMAGAGAGGGGAGGGANAATGGGGSSGVVLEAWVGDGVTPLTSYVFVFGSAGTAGSNAGGTGGDGGDAQVTVNPAATVLLAKGGKGGGGVTSAASTFGAPGALTAGSTAVGVNGVVAAVQDGGDVGFNVGGYFYSGEGGQSSLGTAGNTFSGTGAGVTATGFGAGGGGASATAVGMAGGAGAPCGAIIEEYS